ncbi:MAG: hypothetical protein ABI905_10815 [Betaproteobacteria bacterium]
MKSRSLMSFLHAAAAALGMLPVAALAGSSTGTTSASASLNFRIEIPAVMRVTPVAQQQHIVIRQRDIDRGYVDVEGATSVKLTNNTRNAYVLSASYNPQLLAAVEVRIDRHRLNASAGVGSMRVATGFIVDKLVDISYRFQLAPGVRAGEYRWPVALAFSQALI